MSAATGENGNSKPDAAALAAGFTDPVATIARPQPGHPPVDANLARATLPDCNIASPPKVDRGPSLRGRFATPRVERVGGASLPACPAACVAVRRRHASRTAGQASSGTHAEIKSWQFANGVL
ncbi:MAG: hypothetical protein DCC68_06265 [Planctomycetota bacterium]|nr:MAG: hypothetical protein DCC68_06265 [Planctomycetota bacterium]